MTQDIWTLIVSTIAVVLGTFSASLLAMGREWLRQKIKDSFYQRISLIIWEAILACWLKFLPKIQDGSFSADDKAAFKAEVLAIVTPRLIELRGFAKDKLGVWLSTQVDVLLGKFMLTIGIGESQSGEPGESEEDLANAVATESIGFKLDDSED